MPVTIHVNGTSNSLCHKGSMGIAKSTIPDVCKTPSPGGPVPIPYPVIVSMSSQLANGTTTVKADGGNMIAVKGSEFSSCNGDEPGTAGGVKSSTNMKEATWILYSFDVKMDGKNACRLSDKMQMNHGNSACLAGLIQKDVNGDNVLVLECNPDWDDPCMNKQMKAKAAELDKVAKEKGKLDLMPSNKKVSKAIAKLRQLAEKHQAAYRKKALAAPSAAGPTKNHYDDCAMTNGNPLEADHVQELQIGGKPDGPFLMLDSRVNGSSGSQIRARRKENPGGISVVAVTTKGC